MDRQSIPTDFPFEDQRDLLEYYHYLVDSLQPTWLATTSEGISRSPSAIEEQEQPSPPITFDLNLPAPSTEYEEADHFAQIEAESEGEQVVEFLAYNEDLENDSIEWTDSDDDEVVHENVEAQHGVHNMLKRRIKVLTNKQRAAIADKLQQWSNDSELPRGSIKELSQKYNVSRWSISRIWKSVGVQMQNDQAINVNNLRTGTVGRKRCNLDIDRLMDTPLCQRTTVVATAKALGIHKSTLHRMVKRRQVKKVTNSIKPYLTVNHKLARIRWVLSSLVIPRPIREIPKFRNMYNYVHTDEKWFCFSKISQRYYLAPGEVGPDRKCKNKRFIKKIMFYAAVARPHIMPGTQDVHWDGKIGIWPFVDKVAAKKTSKNRVKGTIETKAEVHCVDSWSGCG